jgi:hypothetical protein
MADVDEEERGPSKPVVSRHQAQTRVQTAVRASGGEGYLQPYALYTSHEALFSRTGPCLLPVAKVDNRPAADGKPGPIVQQLLAAWSEAVGMDMVG